MPETAPHFPVRRAGIGHGVRPWVLATLLLAWAAAHVASRVLISPALELDEAEQALWTQSLALGYGAQPPLYTWLQAAFFGVLGTSLIALSALKLTLLALTLFLLWRASLLVASERVALLASASLLLIPAFGWESLRDLTHTVLLTCLVAATWLALLHQVWHPRPLGLAWLGVVLGLGLLSKYNYALFALALGAAALSVPEARAALLTRRWWLLPLAALLVVLPHALWLLQHWELASSDVGRKLQAGSATWPRLGGAASLVEAVVSNLALWLLVAWLVFRGGRRSAAATERAADGGTAWARLLLQRYFLILAACLVAMVVLGVAHFKSRWLYPFLIVAPLTLLMTVPQERLLQRGRFFIGVTLGFALLCLVLLSLRPWINAHKGAPDDLNAPVRALRERLLAAGYDGSSPVIASDRTLAGNLRVLFPRAPVQVCAPSTATCTEALQSAARGALHIARATRPPESWWRLEGTTTGPPPAVAALRLPYQPALAAAPAAVYWFAWRGAAHGAATAGRGARSTPDRSR